MPKLTVEDLKKIKDKKLKEISPRQHHFRVAITVHMGESGIAAGARDVMTALLEEAAAADCDDVQVLTADSYEKGKNEPYVSVSIKGQNTVLYQNMDADKIRQVFQKHILADEILKEFTAPG